MPSFLREIFGCCFTTEQIDESSSTTECVSDIIYIFVPRNQFEAYFANEPTDLELDLSGFMALYKYATDNLVSNPGLGYMYEKFVFLVDSEYVCIEGWVPIPKLDLSWCYQDESRKSATSAVHVFGSNQAERPGPSEVMCVDINRKMSTAELLFGIKEENIYSSNALLFPEFQRGKLFTYSRHMNACLNCRGEITEDTLKKLGFKRNW